MADRDARRLDRALPNHALGVSHERGAIDMHRLTGRRPRGRSHARLRLRWRRAAGDALPPARTRPRRRRRQRPAGAALRQPEIRSRQPAAGPRHRVSDAPGCSGAPGCPSRSSRSSRAGARCAMRKARRAGCSARMLSGRRTALVLPWEVKAGPATGRRRRCATTTARARARRPRSRPACSPASSPATGGWCRVSVGGFRGYIEQTKLWGAYQGEMIN